VNDALQQGAKGSTGGLHYRLRALFVISQVALSLLLLAGSGLLIKSFFNLRGTNPGFDPERVMTAEITLPRVRYADDEEKQIRTQQLIEDKLAAIPGIENAGTVDPLPLNGNIRASSFMVSGAAPLPPGQHPGAGRLVVSPTYFQTMKIPLLSGRFFNRTDGKASRAVVMINQTFARTFFPDRDPLTQQVLLDMGDNKVNPLDIVGVVGDSHHDNLNREVEPEFYLTYAQDPSRTLDIVLRLATPHLSGLDATVKNAVHAVDKDLFVPTIAPMNNYLSNQVAQPRFNMILLAAFAGIAMLLAAIGIYGVIAGNVAQRTREIGIRMALGAQRTQMLRMILWQSITLVAIGLAIGFVVALAATRLMQSLLYGVGANDPSTYAIVFFLLGGTALLASYIPARRAMKVDPMIALRYE
jgi:putative ABC transport system permease protein